MRLDARIKPEHEESHQKPQEQAHLTAHRMHKRPFRLPHEGAQAPRARQLKDVGCEDVGDRLTGSPSKGA
jgi:hypothetical protein